MSSMTLAMLLMLKDMASGPLGKFASNLTAVGATARGIGQQMVGAMAAPIKSFMEAEDAAIRLKVATMQAGGVVSKDFAAMEKLSVSLGNKLPGTAAEMSNMFAVLAKGGVSTHDILHGVGEASGNLAVMLKMPFEEAAQFSVKTSKAMNIAAKDMSGWMDTIQKVSHLNVSATDMGYAFAKAGSTLSSMGVAGKEASENFVPLMAQLIQTGQSGETVGTNMSAALNNLRQFEMGMDKPFAKARASLKSMGVELDVFDKMGKLRGPRELVQELGKLKALAPEKQMKAMRDIFGDGQDAEFMKKLMDGGPQAYDNLAKDMKSQASLNERIKEILTSLTNIWESARGAFETTLGKFGKAIAPELKAAAEWFGKMSDKVGELIDKHPQIAKFAAATALLGGGALMTGGSTLMGIGMMASAASSAAPALAKVGDQAGKLKTKISDAAKGAKAWNAATGPIWVSNAQSAASSLKTLPGLVTAKAKAMGTAASGALKTMPGQMKAYAVSNAAAAGGALKGLPGLIGAKAKAMGTAVVAAGRWAKANLLSLSGLRSLAAAGYAKIVGGLRAIAMGFRAVSIAALMNPVGLVIVAIAAAIAVAAVLIYKYWRPISGFFKGLWAGLKAGLAPLKPAFTKAFAGLAPILTPIMNALKGVWNWLKNILTPVDDVGGRAQSMGVKFGTALAKIIVKGAEMLAFFTGMAGKFITIGAQMMSGLLSGIMSGAGKVLAKIGEIAGQIKSKFAGLLGIHSPSRVFMGFGQNLGQGLEIGMGARLSQLKRAAGSMAQAATPQFSKAAVPTLAARGGSGAGSSGGTQYVFSPVLQLDASVPGAVRDQLNQGMVLSFHEFKRMLERVEVDRKRARG